MYVVGALYKLEEGEKPMLVFGGSGEGRLVLVAFEVSFFSLISPHLYVCVVHVMNSHSA